MTDALLEVFRNNVLDVLSVILLKALSIRKGSALRLKLSKSCGQDRGSLRLQSPRKGFRVSAVLLSGKAKWVAN